MLVLFNERSAVACPYLFTINVRGAKELAQRGGAGHPPSAAEDAATMDASVLTRPGTITMNQLAVTGVIPLERASESERAFRRRPCGAGSTRIQLTTLSSPQRMIATSSQSSQGHARLLHTVRCENRGRKLSRENGQRFRVMKARANVARGLWAPIPALSVEARVSASTAKGYRTLASRPGP